MLPSLLIVFLASPVLAAPAAKLRYNRDIRPILSDNCFACHGPDKNHREADLRLDVREAAIEMKAIIPGKPEASSLVERLHSHDEDDVMPPPESKKVLTAAQKKLIEEWILQGADYEPHWSYTRLVRPPVPVVPGLKSPPANPIDAFIQAELMKKNLQLSPKADPRTLVRRLSLDLIGLPPTPAEAAQADFSTQVRRLMISPHFGERWAAWWLDVARYADTVGFHGDQNQRIFPYRDYVIDAFNANKRFDQFTLEQLAGDLLPNATTEQRIASGFNRLNMMTREGGAQAMEYLTKYQADRVRTVGGAWLGATLGCAECHDHKFDPFLAKDFYSMSAYFADVKQFGVYSSYRQGESEELKGWSNDHPFPPEILVESPYLQRRLKQIQSRMAEVASTAAKTQPAALAQWQHQTRLFLQSHPDGWAVAEASVQTKLAPATDKKGKPKTQKTKPEANPDLSKSERREDGSYVIHASAAQETVFKWKPGVLTLAAIKLELLPTETHQGSLELKGGSQGMTLTPEFSVAAAPQKPVKLNIRHAAADHYEPRYAGTADLIGVQSGWKTRGADSKLRHTSVWLLEAPRQFNAQDELTMRLPNHRVGCLRISFSPVAPLQPLQALSESQLDAAHWLVSSPGIDSATRSSFTRLHAEALECRDGKAWTQVTVAVKEPMTIRRLPRGNWMDTSGEICLPAPPEFLAGKPAAEAPRQSRIDLARWLCSPENPLTARAFMNRLWKQFFGQGLSMAIDDLGAQGETPSHPELLDWLACEFRDSGWDIQHMMKLIVLSDTYQQDSKTRPELKDLDPNNRLLAFQNPRRLDAEFVRDNALFAAGILNLADIGGPSVKPYQPANYYENLQFPNRDYIADGDDRQWRRGVYMHWQRTFLHPMLANFDAPARDESACTRNVSNTPQQALTLLNDPTFVEAARCLAESLTGPDAGRLDQAYQRCLARLPKPAEKQGLLAFLKSQREVFAATPEEAKKLLATGLRPTAASDVVELAAWTSVCRVLLNLHETITRY